MTQLLPLVVRLHQRWRIRKKFIFPLSCLLLILLMTACGRGEVEAGEDPQVQVQIRAPHPTFTVTPRPAAKMVEQAPTATPALASPTDSNSPPANNTIPEQPTTAPAGAAALTGARPKAIVNTPLVNLRAGPGTDHSIVTLVERGQEFEIVGKNAAGDWWNICCFEEQTAWVTDEFIDTDGLVDSVPVVTGGAQALAPTSPTVAQPTAASQNPPAQEPAPTSPPESEVAVASAPGFNFNLVVQEQFPEPNVMRIFLYVYDDKSALEGFTLRVSKDGAELPVSAVSFGPNPGFTWPVADPRQRWQNLKIEFPGEAPAGVWEVQLMQNGAAAGPPATFTLLANDLQQELYVRYERQPGQ